MWVRNMCLWWLTFGPGGPTWPGGPTAPSLPLSPLSPRSPGGPVSPVRPFVPGRPKIEEERWREMRDLHYKYSWTLERTLRPWRSWSSDSWLPWLTLIRINTRISIDNPSWVHVSKKVNKSKQIRESIKKENPHTRKVITCWSTLKPEALSSYKKKRG